MDRTPPQACSERKNVTRLLRRLPRPELPSGVSRTVDVSYVPAKGSDVDACTQLNEEEITIPASTMERFYPGGIGEYTETAPSPTAARSGAAPTVQGCRDPAPRCRLDQILRLAPGADRTYFAQNPPRGRFFRSLQRSSLKYNGKTGRSVHLPEKAVTSMKKAPAGKRRGKHRTRNSVMCAKELQRILHAGGAPETPLYSSMVRFFV